MKKNCAFILIFIHSLYGQAQEKGTTLTLSVTQAMEYAIQNRPDAKNLKLQENIATNQTALAKTLLYPRINGTVDARDNIILPTSILPIDFRNQPGTPAFNQPAALKFGTKYNLTASMDLTQPIFDATYFSGLKYAKANEEYQRRNSRKELTDIMLSVVQAYYAVLLNNEKAALSKKTMERNRKYLEDAQIKFQNAGILRSDLDKIYLDHVNASTAYAKDLKNFDLSRQHLVNQLGAGDHAQITLSSTFEQELYADTSSFQNEQQNLSVESRPEVQIEQSQMLMNEMNLKKTRDDYLPKFTFYGYLAAQNYFILGNHWYPINYFGIKLTTPIFDGFQRKNNIDDLKIRLMANHNNLDKLKRDFTYEANSALANLQTNYDNVKLWQQNVALASRVLEVSRVRFKESSLSAADLANSENTLKETETNYLTALNDFLVAKINWEKAKGSLY